MDNLRQTASVYGVSRDNLEGQYLIAHMAAMEEAHCKLVLAFLQDMQEYTQQLATQPNTELQKIRENENQYQKKLSDMLGILNKKISLSLPK